MSPFIRTIRAVSPDTEVRDQSPSIIPRTTRLTVLEVILWFSFTVPLLLLQLPWENVDGSPVPTVIFKGLSSTFQGFLVSVTLAFTGAFSALVIDDGSQFTRACRYLSMASMASAVIFLVWALTFKSLFSSFQLRNLVSLYF